MTENRSFENIANLIERMAKQDRLTALKDFLTAVKKSPVAEAQKAFDEFDLYAAMTSLGASEDQVEVARGALVELLAYRTALALVEADQEALTTNLHQMAGHNRQRPVQIFEWLRGRADTIGPAMHRAFMGVIIDAVQGGGGYQLPLVLRCIAEIGERIGAEEESYRDHVVALCQRFGVDAEALPETPELPAIPRWTDLARTAEETAWVQQAADTETDEAR